MNARLKSTPLRDLFAGAMPRAAALFLGAFSFVNGVGDLLRPGFAEDLWWIDLRLLPGWLTKLFLLISSVCLIGFALRLPGPGWRRRLTATCAGALGLTALGNSIRYYLLLGERQFVSHWPLPLSLLVAAGLARVEKRNLCYWSADVPSGGLISG
jgi:hypothetical protein